MWGAQIVVAVIFLQTLFFKFTGAEEAVALFSALGVEPWGSILVGTMELFSGIMLLIPATAVYGAILVLVVVIGAILSHIFVLGIAFQGSYALFIMAVIVFLLSLWILYERRKEIKFLRK